MQAASSIILSVTLLELIANVCTATGYLEDDDKAACRTFLTQRDRLIYDSALWKDSLVMCPVAVDPVNNADHAEGLVLLPEAIGRPVAVRTAENAVRVNGLETYFRYDADKFAETGTPFEFSIMPPAWFTVRPVADPFTHTNVVVPAYAFSVVDNIPGAPVGIFDVLGSTVNLTVGKVYQLKAASTMSGYIIKSDDGNFELEKLVRTTAGQTVYFTATSDQVMFLGPDDGHLSGDFHEVGLYAFDGNLDKIELTTRFKSSGAGSTLKLEGDVDAIVRVLWRDSKGEKYNTTGKLPLTLVPNDDAGFFEIDAVFKSSTNAPLTITLIDGTGVTCLQATLAAAATRSPTYQRLRLFGIPSTAVVLKVLGKAKYDPLDFDTQEQTIRNSENCLLAFGRGDLLRRGGENGAAQLAFQEAAALLQQLKDVEAVQAANNQRIIPDSGYGPEWGIGPYIRPYF